MRKTIWRSALLVLLVFGGGFSGCAAQEEPRDGNVQASETASDGHLTPRADGRTVKQRLEDATIATQVQKALLDTMSLRLFDFQVVAERGRVALRGSVDTEAQRRLAATIARDVDGVRDLVNEIDLLASDSLDVVADSTGKESL